MTFNIKHSFILVLITFYSIHNIDAQIGGLHSFEFLSGPQSARLTALGGSLITVMDEDINLATSNPALINKKYHNQFSLSHNFSFTGISNGHLAYGRNIEKWEITAYGGLSYISYGDFNAADEIGNTNGTFSGGETAIVLGAGKELNERISVGANIKTVIGNLESYNSLGVGVDMGITYNRPKSNLKIAMVVKNFGHQFTGYGTKKYGMPLDIQVGVSNQLKHLPFRFSIIAHQLQRWSIRYDDPNRKDKEIILGEPVAEPSNLSNGIDNFFRHIVFNGEFFIGKSEGLKLRFGYNHHRRKELSLSNFRSLAGFNFGIGIRIKGIHIDYGVGYFHLEGANNHLTLRTNLNTFFPKF